MPTINDKAWKDFSQQFRDHVMPNLLSSAIVLSVQGDAAEDGIDIRQAAELGCALLLDKPILIVAAPGRPVSERVRRAADVVVDDWSPEDADSQARLSAAITKLVEQTRKET